MINSRRSALVLSALIAASFICLSPVGAAFNSFNNRTSFNTAAGSIDLTEDFSSFLTDTSFAASPVAANGFSLHQEGSNPSFRNLVDVTPLAFSDNNGTNNASSFVQKNSAGVITNVRITFTNPVKAFGADFYGIEGITAANGLTLNLISSGNSVASFDLTGNGPTNAQFFGFLGNAGESIDSLLLSATKVIDVGGEGFGIDDVALSLSSTTPAVPLPPAFLSGSTLLALTALTKRLRRQ